MSATTGIQETLDRIHKHKGVLGLIIANTDGNIHKSTLEEGLTAQYVSLVPSLASLAHSMVRELDPQNDLEFLRIRSSKHEIMVAPRGEYVLIVVQDPAVAQAGV